MNNTSNLCRQIFKKKSDLDHQNQCKISFRASHNPFPTENWEIGEFGAKEP